MLVSGIKNQNISQPNRANNNISSGSAFRVYDVQQQAPAKVKAGVLLTTLAGVAAAMLWTFETKKMPTKNLKDFFTNLTKIPYKDKEIPKLVARLAGCSVGGGLLGGALFDKQENMKAKYREAVIQLVGNVATPLLCVGAGGSWFKKHVTPKIVSGCNLKGKFADVPNALASAILLVGAIFAGNKAGNLINQKVFNVNDDRKLNITDMAPHVDDACLALTLVADDTPIGNFMKRIIPAALMVAGFSTGIAQESTSRKIEAESVEIEKEFEQVK